MNMRVHQQLKSRLYKLLKRRRRPSIPSYSPEQAASILGVTVDELMPAAEELFQEELILIFRWRDGSGRVQFTGK
jgi:hypothetical protein